MRRTCDLSLYLATDRSLLGTRALCEVVEEAIRNGVTVVQLREKTCSARAFFDLGRRLHAVTRRHGVPLIINDRVDIALALGCEGVHVGPSDLPLSAVRALSRRLIVGASVNSLDDLAAAEAGEADYIGVGPVFATATKSDARRVLGLTGLESIVRRSRLPCVAIGGITPGRAESVYATGVAGICAISAILGQSDIGAAVRRFRALAPER